MYIYMILQCIYGGLNHYQFTLRGLLEIFHTTAKCVTALLIIVKALRYSGTLGANLGITSAWAAAKLGPYLLPLCNLPQSIIQTAGPWDLKSVYARDAPDTNEEPIPQNPPKERKAVCAPYWEVHTLDPGSKIPDSLGCCKGIKAAFP